MRVRDFPSVRDRLWLLAHEEDGMRLLIDVRALDIGLTGAALADLLLSAHIEIRQGCIYPDGRHREGDVTDPITSGILTAVRAGAGLALPEVFRSARTDTNAGPWRPFQRLYARTAAELVAAGGLRAEGRFLRGTRYQPADPYLLSSVRAQFNRRLAFSNDPADPGVDCLCALAQALNLHRGLAMPFNSNEADAILTRIVAQIPIRARPGSPLARLPDLADGVRHAIGDLATAPF